MQDPCVSQFRVTDSSRGLPDSAKSVSDGSGDGLIGVDSVGKVAQGETSLA